MVHKVKMYTLSTCSHCRAAKKSLNDNGISFEFIDVDLLQNTDKENILREVVKLSSAIFSYDYHWRQNYRLVSGNLT